MIQKQSTSFCDKENILLRSEIRAKLVLIAHPLESRVFWAVLQNHLNFFRQLAEARFGERTKIVAQYIGELYEV